MAAESVNSMGIAQKLLTAMLLVALVPLAADWLINYRITSRELGAQASARLAASGASLARYVDLWLEMNARVLRQNALHADIKSMEAQRQGPVLRGIVSIFDWNYLAFTVDLGGRNVGRSDDAPPKNYADRGYVQAVLGGADFASEVVVGRTSGQPALVMAVPVHSEFGRLNGVLAIAMTLRDLSTAIAAERIGRTGAAVLLDAAGRLIAHSAAERVAQRAEFTDHPALGVASRSARTRLIEYRDARGVQMLASVTPTTNGWTLVVEQHRAEVLESVNRANQIALLLLAVTVLLVALVSVLVARRLTDPISRLTEAAEAISRGQLAVAIEGTERGDELGALARAVARLGASLRLAMNKLSGR